MSLYITTTMNIILSKSMSFIFPKTYTYIWILSLFVWIYFLCYLVCKFFVVFDAHTRHFLFSHCIWWEVLLWLCLSGKFFSFCMFEFFLKLHAHQKLMCNFFTVDYRHVVYLTFWFCFCSVCLNQSSLIILSYLGNYAVECNENKIITSTFYGQNNSTSVTNYLTLRYIFYIYLRGNFV